MSSKPTRMHRGHHAAARPASGDRRRPTLRRRSAKATDLLSTTLASGAFARLVGYFAVRPHDAPHIRALMRQTGLTARSLQLELERLERLGLVRREVTADGRVHIHAAGRTAAWAPFRDLVRAYADPAELLRFALTDVPGISAAFVFGSVADKTAGDESDVDLFVIAAHGMQDDARMLDRALAQRTVEASLGIGREVNVVVLTASQLAAKLANGRAFYANVVAGPKRWVLGNPSSLRTVQRMARAKAEVVA